MSLTYHGPNADISMTWLGPRRILARIAGVGLTMQVMGW